MRFENHLFESTITDMAKEFVRFQTYVNSVMDYKAKDSEKAKETMRLAFIELDSQIKKALKTK